MLLGFQLFGASTVRFRAMRVYDVVFGLIRLGLMASSLGCWVWRGVRARGLGFEILGHGLMFRGFSGFELRIWNLGGGAFCKGLLSDCTCRCQGLGFRASGLGFWAWR